MPVHFIKPLLFALCLLPTGLLGWQFYADELGANPIEAITRGTGEWTLRLLLITLLMTPLKRVSGWYWPIRVRRMLGLFAFFYACMHLTTYLWLDQFFDWHDAGLRAAGAAGAYLQPLRREEAGPQLEAPAPPRVCDPGAGRVALLVAGEGGYP
jgi:DMSO/TMAO reductase YedYZ heme-binding membrane subunit